MEDGNFKLVKKNKYDNLPVNILHLYFEQRTRHHSPWIPRSDVTEPGVARGISCKNLRAIVSRVFDLSRYPQRQNSL